MLIKTNCSFANNLEVPADFYLVHYPIATDYAAFVGGFNSIKFKYNDIEVQQFLHSTRVLHFNNKL